MAEFTFKVENITDSKIRFIAYDSTIEAGETTGVKTGESLLIIDSTNINDAYRGQRVGNQLVKQEVDFAREQNRKIIPLCPFAKAEFEKNPTMLTF